MRALTLDLSYRSPVLPAGVVAIVVWLVWSAVDGGFRPTQWGLVGAGMVALLAVTVLVRPPRLTDWGRGRTAMLVALAAFVGWNYLSILWADFPADAWTGADKTLVYAAGFALFAMWPWTPRAVTLLLAVFTFGVAVIGLIVLVRLGTAGDATGFFLEGRLRSPVGYVNGNVALWMSAVWPALYIAASRPLHPAVRAVALGAAGLFVDLALLGQSRAWLFLMPVAIGLALLLARQRLRLVLAGTLVTIAALAVVRPLLDVHDQFDRELIADPTLGAEPWLVLAAAAGLALAGVLWALADARVEVPRRAQVALTCVVVAACLAGLAGAGAVAAARIEHPRDWIEARWDDFAGGAARDDNGSRFTGSLSSGRYGEWKVAWSEFLDHPVTGIGSDNYAAAYLERREDDTREPRYPHSIELRMLSQLGIVGTALFLVFLVAAVWLALSRRRRLDAVAGGAVGAAVMVFTYWLLYGSQDWFWEIPALAGPALGLLALAGATVADEDRPGEPRTTPGEQEPSGSAVSRGAAAAAVVGIALVAGAALVVPALAAAYSDAALAGWRSNPELAVSRLERAADLNRLSAEPYLLEGSMALQLGDTALAREAFGRALEREPKNWYAYLQLALLEGSLGNTQAARAQLTRALELNPNDKVADRVRRLLEAGREIDPGELNARYLRQWATRFPGSLRSPTTELG